MEKGEVQGSSSNGLILERTCTRVFKTSIKKEERKID